MPAAAAPQAARSSADAAQPDGPADHHREQEPDKGARKGGEGKASQDRPGSGLAIGADLPARGDPGGEDAEAGQEGAGDASPRVAVRGLKVSVTAHEAAGSPT